jgi:hypothetical protein
LFRLNAVGQFSLLTQRAGIQYLWLAGEDQLPVVEANLIEPFFSLARREGRSRLYRVNRREVPLEYLEWRVLLRDPNGASALTVDFDRNFYSLELVTALDSGRWMSNDAEIIFDSRDAVRGTISFLTHAFQQSRTMQVLSDHQLLHQVSLSPEPVKVSFPVSFRSGKNILKIHSLEGAGHAGPGDHRLLSFRIWNLKFRKSG